MFREGWKIVVFHLCLWRNGLVLEHFCSFPNYPSLCINKIFKRHSSKSRQWYLNIPGAKSGGTLSDLWADPIPLTKAICYGAGWLLTDPVIRCLNGLVLRDTYFLLRGQFFKWISLVTQRLELGLQKCAELTLKVWFPSYCKQKWT